MKEEAGVVFGRTGLRKERAPGATAACCCSTGGSRSALSWKPLRESQSLPEMSRDSPSLPLWKRRLEGRMREGGGRGSGRGDTER
jgi:hypothetical protein